LVPPLKQKKCYEWLKTHLITNQEQAFIVCPFIESSDTMTEVKSATDEYKILQETFPKLNIGLIHSKISSTIKEKILDDFGNKKIDIIVTTPLIEVGIDFPNATVIIIQSADRFGLASLHQLRGRVGRGEKPGYCYLFTNKIVPRLEYLTKHYEGQKLAEYDLKSRGPGQFFSTQQHGHFELNYESIRLGHKIINDLINQFPNFNIEQYTNQTTTTQLNN
jgi:ATP-dependent DNA helicase RecG